MIYYHYKRTKGMITAVHVQHVCRGNDGQFEVFKWQRKKYIANYSRIIVENYNIIVLYYII